MLLFAFVIHSKDSKFEHTLRIEPASLYSKIYLIGGVAENHSRGIYQKDKNLAFEGEWKFQDTFSVKLSGGISEYQETDQKTISQWDRWSLGLKFANEVEKKQNRFVYGVGIRIFTQELKQNPRTQNAPNLYLLKPHLSFGFGVGNFELQTEISFQTETNSKLKEEGLEEFRRNYTFGTSFSYQFLSWIKVLLETEYFEPYQKKVDTQIRGWYLYPGFLFFVYDSMRVGVSFQFPITKQDYLYERGVKISYLYYFW